MAYHRVPRTGNLRIYACYINPKVTIVEYDNWLGRHETSIRTSFCDVVVVEDFNAKHRQWCSWVNNDKRELLSDFAQSLRLSVCNYGKQPTWQKGDSQSNIDVTMVSSSFVTGIINWHILEEESHSDHFYIEFRIEGTKIPRLGIKEYTRRNFRNIDQETERCNI